MRNHTHYLDHRIDLVLEGYDWSASVPGVMDGEEAPIGPCRDIRDAIREARGVIDEYLSEQGEGPMAKKTTTKKAAGKKGGVKRRNSGAGQIPVTDGQKPGQPAATQPSERTDESVQKQASGRQPVYIGLTKSNFVRAAGRRGWKAPQIHAALERIGGNAPTTLKAVNSEHRRNWDRTPELSEWQAHELDRVIAGGEPEPNATGR